MTIMIMGGMPMLEYEFMRNALAGGALVAIVSSVVGYFLVLRGQTFAGHALSHTGFAGATAAVLIGIPPLWGLVSFTLGAGVAMGLLGERISGRDVAIGMVLSLSLGFGLLFLHFYTAYATAATAVLFGNVLAIDRGTLMTLAGLGIVALGALALISRPLLFASLQPELAQARGVSLTLVGTLFLMIVAIATAEAAQIVGVLLVFTLMVGPAAAAQCLTTRIWSGIALSVALALVEALGGIALAYYTDWPSSFCITALTGLIYFAASMAPRWRMKVSFR